MKRFWAPGQGAILALLAIGLAGCDPRGMFGDYKREEKVIGSVRAEQWSEYRGGMACGDRYESWKFFDQNGSLLISNVRQFWTDPTSTWMVFEDWGGDHGVLDVVNPSFLRRPSHSSHVYGALGWCSPAGHFVLVDPETKEKRYLKRSASEIEYSKTPFPHPDGTRCP